MEMYLVVLDTPENTFYQIQFLYATTFSKVQECNLKERCRWDSEENHEKTDKIKDVQDYTVGATWNQKLYCKRTNPPS